MSFTTEPLLMCLVSPLFSLLLFLVACYCWPFSPVQQVVGLSEENGCFLFSFVSHFALCFVTTCKMGILGFVFGNH